jgi:DNA transformation protein
MMPSDGKGSARDKIGRLKVHVRTNPLVMHETLYLKTDERNRGEFDARGLEAFTFRKGGETIETGYRAAPEEALEDPRVMAAWARGAYEAALRKAARKPAARRKAKRRAS